MTQRIAPKNNLPATHFIEVWKGRLNIIDNTHVNPIEDLFCSLNITEAYGYNTIAIFRIRENKLPTLNKF